MGDSPRRVGSGKNKEKCVALTWTKLKFRENRPTFARRPFQENYPRQNSEIHMKNIRVHIMTNKKKNFEKTPKPFNHHQFKQFSHFHHPPNFSEANYEV